MTLVSQMRRLQMITNIEAWMTEGLLNHNLSIVPVSSNDTSVNVVMSSIIDRCNIFSVWSVKGI